MSPIVTVYTKPGCMPCEATKRRLARRGIAYDTVDVSVDASAADELRAEGFAESPVVMVALGDVVEKWSGYRPDRIDSLPAAAA